MNGFLDDNFLLNSSLAEELYHDYAKKLPIIDYHNHLPPSELAHNRSYDNITQLWLEGDHYKWRAMRNLGIDEKFITGNASDKDKFKKWASTLPYAMRNPLYHWSHLEMKRYFGIDAIINEDSAEEVYSQCNELLKTPDFTAQGLINKMNVRALCTTDDPIDDLKHHKTLSMSSFETVVLPTFRPDGVININDVQFNTYLETLSQVSGIEINNFETLLNAIQSRVDYFHENGCRLSDHGLSHLYDSNFTIKEVNRILDLKFKEGPLTTSAIETYKSAILFFLGKMYAEKGWTMQLHLGPIRDANKALLRKIGMNAGVDSIGDFPQAIALSRFLSKLNDDGNLPKTIIYNSNPADNDVFATMAGNFSEGGIKGKVQFGAAWWFLDQKEGITNQINSLSNMGLLSATVGMLTDSRSFLSFPRHEYYRRILCNIFGEDITNGELPNDVKWVGKIISDICYFNALHFFDFGIEKHLQNIKVSK